jgi:hypothetical protein
MTQQFDVLLNSGKIANARIITRYPKRATEEIIERYGKTDIVTIAHGDKWALYFWREITARDLF